MKVRLVIQHQKANVKSVVLHSDAVIGRSTDCNLRLASGKISRKHCKLLINDDRVAIIDLGSSNGTYLNKQKLDANVETAISPGEQLSVGAVTFVVQYNDPSAETQIRKNSPESETQSVSESPMNDDMGNDVTPAAGNVIVPSDNAEAESDISLEDVDIDEISDAELEALLADEGFEPEAEQFSVEFEEESTDANSGEADDTINFSLDQKLDALDEFDDSRPDA